MALQPIGLDATINGVPDFTAGINKMNAGVDSFAQNSTKQGGMFAGGFGEIVTGALRKIGELGVQALLQAGRAVAGFVKDSIGLAGDFEAGMNEFRVAAGKDIDTKGIEQFHDLFLQLGKDLPVSTSDVQQAAIEMVKGGLDPAILAAGGLKQNIQFAAAAMKGDLVGAATISSKIIAGWAEVGATAAQKAELLTHATDLLTKAANASSVDVHELSLGLFNVQATAKSAGIGIDDVTTVLAELAGDFSSASVAGNSMASFITRLQPTTADATAKMKELGLFTDATGSAFYDATGNFVGFQQASQILQESLKGLTNEQRQSALQTIFQKDAIAVANGLAERGAAGYDAMALSLQNAMGVQEAGTTIQGGFNIAAENARGSVEALQIQLGEYLLPILTTLFNDVITPGINTLSDLASALFGDQEAFDKLSPTMQGVAVAIQGFVDDLTTGIAVAQAIAVEVEQMIGAFSSASDSSSDLGGALDQLNGVWQLALKVVTDVANGYMAIAQAVLPVVQRFWTEHGEEVLAFVQTTYDTLIKIVTTALELYDAIVPPILNAIAGFISAHGEEITKILSGAWEMISSLITGTLQTIQAVIKLALDLIHGDWAAAWTDIGTIVDVQAKAIGGIVSGFLDMIAGLFNTSMADIAQTWADNWAMLVDIATQTDWAAVGESVVSGILQGLKDNWDSLVDWVLDALGNMITKALERIKAGSPAVEWMPVGEFSVLGIMDGFQSTWPALTSMVSDLGDDLVQQAADIADKVQSAIGQAFSATANINRQKIANMKAVAGISETQRGRVQQDINTAESVAARMTDPKQAAAYFKMQSQHLIELAKLRDQVDKEVDPAAREALIAQYVLVAAAQKAEEEALRANAQAQSNPNQEIAAMMQKLLGNEALPGMLENPVIKQLFGMLQQLTSPPGMAQSRLVGNSTSMSYTTNLNMPIYTNNSPSALQSSMAIAGAALL